MRVAVVGHVEWITFAQVPQMPAAGEIVHASRTWDDPGGGGSVAAVQLARLAPGAWFLTALAEDELGRRAASRLEELGVVVHAAPRPPPQRRGFTHLDDAGERTITVMGDRIVPTAADPLPWDELADVDAVYLTGGDAGAVQAARHARVLVATPRASEALAEAGVELDALVYSAGDADEARWARESGHARYLVATRGKAGGEFTAADGTTGEWQAAGLPGPIGDAYGAGDSFAATLAFALGRGDPIEDAVALAARAGATCMTGHGPYERQLTAADV